MTRSDMWYIRAHTCARVRLRLRLPVRLRTCVYAHARLNTRFKKRIERTFAFYNENAFLKEHKKNT